MGKSGLKLSALSFGSWVTFGSQIQDDTSERLMQMAYENGINFFDNAEAYASGKSEEVMGAILKKVNWNRSTFVVSSKVFWGGDKPNQKGLLAHYEKIANNVDIKQILYNVPSRTACDLKPETVSILSKHKNIVGLKEAVDDIERIKELVKISNNSTDFTILSGDDPTFMDSLIEGAHGVISVAANVIPKSISQICKHIRKNNISEAKKLNEFNNNIYRLLFVESNPIPVKWMLAKMGMIENSIRLPLIELDETYHDEILSELYKLKLI